MRIFKRIFKRNLKKKSILNIYSPKRTTSFVSGSVMSQWDCGINMRSSDSSYRAKQPIVFKFHYSQIFLQFLNSFLSKSFILVMKCPVHTLLQDYIITTCVLFCVRFHRPIFYNENFCILAYIFCCVFCLVCCPLLLM